ncbi:MAG: hypothetical protein LBK23_03800 [Oscillospiraceae bacterium]|jgi:hypothetical protein|nr:hypothetical protein [Oscillospiraceae bacterium]
MEYFVQQCFTRIKAIVEPLGFKRDKKLFGRIINDVWQSFYIDIINRTKDYAVCRVGFEISPLCRKLEYQWIFNTWVLELGEPLGRQQRDYWDYSRTSEESVNSCIDIIIENISVRLIPLFEQAIDSKMALNALCSVERKICESIFKTPDIDVYWTYDNNKLYMALKHEDYNFILHTHEMEILIEKMSLESNRQSAIEHYGYPSFEPEKYNIPPIVVKNIRDKIAEYEKKASKRISHNQTFIDILKARNNKEVQWELYRQLNDRAEKDGKPQLHPQDIIKLICEQDEPQIRKQLEENEAYSREQLKRFIVQKH